MKAKLERAFGHVKQWLKSWTINFGLLLQCAAVVQMYVGGLGNPFFTMVIGLIVVGLRFKTNQPVHEK